MRAAAHWGSLAGLAGLLVLVPSWVIAGNLSPWWALAVLPLLAALPGVLRRRARAYLGASVASLLYVFHGLVALVSVPAARLPATLEAALSLLLLLAAAFAARWSRPTP
ncbi:MAG: DUF2069 domain-containing protein [Gammaproteobacteria bacterium]